MMPHSGRVARSIERNGEAMVRRLRFIAAAALVAGVGAMFASAADTPDWVSQTVPGYDGTTTGPLKGVFFLSHCVGWAVGEEASGGAKPTIIVKTIDGGKHWDLVHVIDGATLNRVQFVDESTGWIVGEGVPDPGGKGTILKTSDGGTTWTAQTNNQPGSGSSYKDIEGISFVSPSEGWLAESLYSSSRGRILHTANGGASFLKQTIPNPTDPVADVSFVDNQNGWAVTDGGKILHTSNGGGSGPNGWKVQKSTVGDFESVKFWDTQRGVAVGGSGKVLWTSNGGTTWTLGATGVTSTLNDVGFFDATHLLVASETVGGATTMLYSSDGGATFSPESSSTAPGADLKSVSVVPGTDFAWAVGAGPDPGPSEAPPVIISRSHTACPGH